MFLFCLFLLSSCVNNLAPDRFDMACQKIGYDKYENLAFKNYCTKETSTTIERVHVETTINVELGQVTVKKIIE